MGYMCIEYSKVLSIYNLHSPDNNLFKINTKLQSAVAISIRYLLLYFVRTKKIKFYC